MRTKFTILLFLAILSNTTFNLYGQNNQNDPMVNGGEYPLQMNDAKQPCITLDQYKIIEKRIKENCKRLGNINPQKQAMITSFNWPLKMSNGLNDCSYYHIGNYVDHDPASPGIKDWNCGSVTYDGHRGMDIGTFPYPFYKMDNNQVEVIAAAPGTIVEKLDGNFDKNCSWNNSTANYIVIQHTDGSLAHYFHMKRNSVTAKTIGQTVMAGEYLGVVGSSGISTGPHLHFEIWNNNNFNSIQDPYAGSCNSLNNSSWWAAQKPYTEPAIMQASIHPALAVFPACPSTEIPNEDSCFIGGSTASFYIFVRNQVASTTANLRIINPNGTTFNNWTINFTNSYQLSYWYFNQILPTAPGTYTFETVYNGATCSKQFTINCAPLSISEPNNGIGTFNVFPNPFSFSTTIQTNNYLNNATLTVYNSLGQEIKQLTNISGNTITLSRENIPKGLYFINLTDEKKVNITKKIIIND